MQQSTRKTGQDKWTKEQSCQSKSGRWSKQVADSVRSRSSEWHMTQPASKQKPSKWHSASAASEQQTQQQSQCGRPRKGSKLRQSKQWMEQTSGRPSKCHAQQRASSRASSKVSNGPRSKAAAKQAADGALHQLHFHSQCRDPWPVVL
jgi:hypothetical protein